MTLLKWAFFFLIFAAVAGLLGFGGLAEGAADIGKVLLVIFLIIAGALLILGLTVYRTVTD